MRRTLDFLESLQPYEKGEILSKPWLDLCACAYNHAKTDAIDLLNQSHKTVRQQLLPNTVLEGNYFLQPYHHMGMLTICPDDEYRQKTGQLPLATIRKCTEPGFVASGIELEIAMLRRVLLPNYGSDMVKISSAVIALKFNNEHEIQAFRDIYDDQRGIVRNLLQMAPIDFFMSAVIPEVDNVRSKKPIPRLDAVLHLKDPQPDDWHFELTYTWYSNSDYAEGVRAFRSLAILFTCIQKAASSPRTKHDQLLRYWNSIQDRFVTYPRVRQFISLVDEDNLRNSAETQMQEWKQKKNELINTVVQGPFVRANGKSGEMAANVKYAGVALVFSADNRKMDADILLRSSDWRFGRWPLYVKKEQVPFGLCHPSPPYNEIEQTGLISLSHVLGVIYSHAATTTDVLGVLDALSPILGDFQFSPLKRSCFDLINPTLAKMGYAVAAMTAGRDYIRARLVWVFESYRMEKPIRHYLACGTLRISFCSDMRVASVEWLPLTCGDMLAPLRARLIREFGSPRDILSPSGFQFACDCFGRQTGKLQSPRLVQRLTRVRFVAEHKQLWNDHDRLAQALVKAGLYSAKTPRSQIVCGCTLLIVEAKKMCN